MIFYHFFPERSDMARKTKAEAALTRVRILKAALDLFAKKGYEQATLNDVARKIRLTKGAVYWHFKSKPDLLSALVADMAQRHTVEVGRSLAEPDSLEALRVHLVNRAQFVTDVADNKKFFRLMTRLDWSSPRFEPVRRRLNQLETGIFSVIERSLFRLKASGEVRGDVDVPMVSEILGALWLGLLKMKTDKYMTTDLKRAVVTAFDMVAEAIRA